MLARLAVNQKLSLLLMLPLTALVFTIVPLTVQRMDNARAGAAAAQTARLAATVGALLRDLREECALGLAYLVSSDVDGGAVVSAQQLVDDDAARVRRTFDNAPLAGALNQLRELSPVRAAILAKGGDPARTMQRYASLSRAIIDALGLPGGGQLDAAGVRQMDALDAVLRMNDDAGQVDDGLIIAAADPVSAAPVIAAALIGVERDRGRYGQLASQPQLALLGAITSQPTAQQVESLADQYAAPAPSTSARRTGPELGATLSLIQSYAQLRELMATRVSAEAVAAADTQASRARVAAIAAGVSTVVILAAIWVISVRVGRSIASPLRRLARAARAVADIANAELVRVGDSDEASPSPPKLAAVNVRGQDEVGELGAAINRVQATAALMLERQMSTQTNIAVMFANIAYRTQTLVSRQVSLIDDMERDEPDPEILAKLYRLDHVTARLRRSADSLLVVSGTRDIAITTPAALVDVIRAATAEIEGFQAVRLGQVPDAVVASELANDLRLVVAELLENATTFSPPQSIVEITGALTVDDCRIAIVDRGIGMSSTRLADENERLITRPRLDVAPTEVMGLFVVGRLARRHGLTVRLSPTPGQGVTATIVVPGRFLSRAIGAAAPTAVLVSTPAQPGRDPRDFPWFGGAGGADEVAAQLALAAAPSLMTPPQIGQPGQDGADNYAANGSRNGLRRRTPGQQALELGVLVGPPGTRPPIPHPRNPAAEAAQLDAYAQATQRPPANAPPPAVPEPRWAVETRYPPPTAAGPGTARNGLVRRVPGTHLEAAITQSTPSVTSRGPVRRDPVAEQTTLEDFVEGLARAQLHPPTHLTHERPT